MSLLSLVNAAQLPKSLQLQTIHGEWEETDPLIIELILSPAMQRLKGVRHYGSTDYMVRRNVEYTRYIHSLGVYHVLKLKGASRIEQVAGLLHDVSHTVFAHSTEPLFKGGFLDGSYQDDIHMEFMENYGVSDILRKHGISPESISMSHTKLPGLKQRMPNLCGDRLDYNLYAAYMDHGWSKQDVREVLSHVYFEDGRWYFDDIDAARKLSEVSLYQSVNVWASADTIYCGTLTSYALREAMLTKLCGKDDIIYKCTDDTMWGHLVGAISASIRLAAKNIINGMQCYRVVDHGKGDLLLKGKLRGLDPWVKTAIGFKRLSELDPDYKRQYQQIKQVLQQGWSIKLSEKCFGDASAISIKHSAPVITPQQAMVIFFKERFPAVRG